MKSVKKSLVEMASIIFNCPDVKNLTALWVNFGIYECDRVHFVVCLKICQMTFTSESNGYLALFEIHRE